MTLTDRIRQIDLAGVIEAAGVVLSKNGIHPVGLCPFHPDHAPSLTIYDDHFHCFGCSVHGDAVDFVMLRYGFSFKEACRHLGIETGIPSKKSLQKIKEVNQKNAEKKKHLQREKDLIHTLALLIRTTRSAMESLTPDNFNDNCEILEPLCWWEYCYEMLCIGSDKDRHLVVEALKEMTTIRRNYLFKADFNYRKWLDNFLNSGESCKTKTI